MSLESEVRQHLLSRRHFLALGAAGVAWTWTGGLAQAAPAEAYEPLSVGYLQGSNELSIHFDHLKWSVPRRMSAQAVSLPVVSAAALPLGDQELAGGDVKLTIHGLYPAEAADCRGVDAIDLDVLFPAPDPSSPKPARFMAWSFRRRPAPSPSPPVSFRVPLGLDGRLDVTMRAVYQGEGDGLARRVLTGSPLVQRLYAASFTADWQGGRPKLQRGVYLLGVRPGIWEAETSLPRPEQRARQADFCSVVVSVEPIAQE